MTTKKEQIKKNSQYQSPQILAWHIVVGIIPGLMIAARIALMDYPTDLTMSVFKDLAHIWIGILIGSSVTAWAVKRNLRKIRANCYSCREILSPVIDQGIFWIPLLIIVEIAAAIMSKFMET